VSHSYSFAKSNNESLRFPIRVNSRDSRAEKSSQNTTNLAYSSADVADGCREGSTINLAAW
jgi:hypothetical protein